MPLPRYFVTFLTFLTFLTFPASSLAQSSLPDPGALPGSFASFFEGMAEGIGDFFAFGKVRKAGRALEHSSERLAEFLALRANQAEAELLEDASSRYRESLFDARKIVFRLRGERKFPLEEEFLETLSLHRQNLPVAQEANRTLGNLWNSFRDTELAILRSTLERDPHGSSSYLLQALRQDTIAHTTAIQYLKLFEELGGDDMERLTVALSSLSTFLSELQQMGALDDLRRSTFMTLVTLLQRLARVDPEEASSILTILLEEEVQLFEEGETSARTMAELRALLALGRTLPEGGEYPLPSAVEAILQDETSEILDFRPETVELRPEALDSGPETASGQVSSPPARPTISPFERLGDVDSRPKTFDSSPTVQSPKSEVVPPLQGGAAASVHPALEELRERLRKSQIRTAPGESPSDAFLRELPNLLPPSFTQPALPELPTPNLPRVTQPQ